MDIDVTMLSNQLNIFHRFINVYLLYIRIGSKSATEKLIYFTASIVIVYYPKLNE